MRAWDLSFGAGGSGFRKCRVFLAEGLGFRVRAQASGFREFRVWGQGLGI